MSESPIVVGGKPLGGFVHEDDELEGIRRCGRGVCGPTRGEVAGNDNPGHMRRGECSEGIQDPACLVTGAVQDHRDRNPIVPSTVRTRRTPAHTKWLSRKRRPLSGGLFVPPLRGLVFLPVRPHRSVSPRALARSCPRCRCLRRGSPAGTRATRDLWEEPVHSAKDHGSERSGRRS